MMDITNAFLQHVSDSKKFDGGWNDKGKARIIRPPQKRLPFVATASEIVCKFRGEKRGEKRGERRGEREEGRGERRWERREERRGKKRREERA
jgi:hypothetical protein